MNKKPNPGGYAQKAAAVDALRKENQQLRRKVKQLEKSKTDIKEQLKQLKAQSARSACLPASSLIARHKYTDLMVSLCTHFYLLGGCSLQGVVRLLGYLNTTLQWGLTELPCKASVENWLQKGGYHLHQTACTTAGSCPDGYALIADECMVVGQERLLAMVSVAALKTTDDPLQLPQVSVVHLQAKASWDGAAIGAAVAAISHKAGHPPAYLISDGNGNLRKGCERAKVQQIADVGHQLALLMEHTYKHNEAFIAFNKAVAQSRLKEVMKPTAYLLPPQQRVVARFMNLSVWVEWAQRMLDIEAALPAEERRAYGFVKEHAAIIRELGTAVTISTTIGSLFKHQGLCHTTIAKAIEKCWAYAAAAVGSIGGLVEKIQAYLLTQKAKLPNGHTTWHNSSDVVESLFGMYKERKAANKLYGVTPFVLLLPLFARVDRQANSINLDCKTVLQAVYMKNLKQWNSHNLIANQVIRRKKILPKTS